jgi:hypothetical protein
MVELGIRSPNDRVTCFTNPEAKINVVVGNTETYFIESPNLLKY